MKKILLVGSYAESLIKFRGPLLKLLCDQGNEVVACAPDGKGEIIKALESLGAKYRNIFLRRTGLNILDDIRGLLSIHRVVRELRPEIVLAYTIKPVIYGTLSAFWGGVPKIFALITGLGYAFGGGSRKQKMIGYLAKKLYKMAARKSDKMFFQNPDDREVFIQEKILEKSHKGVVINGSGVDIKYYEPAPFPPKIHFLMIARLIREKGIGEYVEAARNLRKRHPESKFFLAGWIDEGPTGIREKDLARWIREGTVLFLGKLDDVRGAIADCSVYVLPSYREGTPRTVLEAMAMGRPIITTDAPGCRETVIEERNGFLVPVKDVLALVEAMEKMIISPGLIERMGRESRKIATEKYDVNKVNQVILREMGL